jgi:hypothetical protein
VWFAFVYRFVKKESPPPDQGSVKGEPTARSRFAYRMPDSGEILPIAA